METECQKTEKRPIPTIALILCFSEPKHRRLSTLLIEWILAAVEDAKLRSFATLRGEVSFGHNTLPHQLVCLNL
jgi:hypothetical protein